MISVGGEARDGEVDACKHGIDEVPFVGTLFATRAKGIGVRGDRVDEIAGYDKSGGMGDERREGFRFKAKKGGLGGWFEVGDVEVRDLEKKDWRMEIRWGWGIWVATVRVVVEINSVMTAVNEEENEGDEGEEEIRGGENRDEEERMARKGRRSGHAGLKAEYPFGYGWWNDEQFAVKLYHFWKLHLSLTTVLTLHMFCFDPNFCITDPT